MAANLGVTLGANDKAADAQHGTDGYDGGQGGDGAAPGGHAGRGIGFGDEGQYHESGAAAGGPAAPPHVANALVAKTKMSHSREWFNSNTSNVRWPFPASFILRLVLSFTR